MPILAVSSSPTEAMKLPLDGLKVEDKAGTTVSWPIKLAKATAKQVAPQGLLGALKIEMHSQQRQGYITGSSPSSCPASQLLR